MRASVTVAAIAAAALGIQTLPARAPITVSADVSLTEALAVAAREYAQAGGGTIRFNFAASNMLARQIVDGAPVDLFVSGDEQQMDVIAAAGLVKAGTRVDFVTNQLAVVVPGGRTRPLSGIRALTDPAFRRIAIGDPDGTPAGVYARQYLQKVGIWDVLAPRMVLSVSVRDALAAVESGAAVAAIVYRTDARIATRASVAWVVPASEGPPIRYVAAVIRTSSVTEEAQRFLDFLRSPRGTGVLTEFGFAPVRAAAVTR
ncbi:MAG TPA: molybdate ABC transporter substrate-binding protein [Vicinamibacterales bacterium]|nr:molybdate ABC transporter substrate-binding protein [Vicinamibacterales bacterium]